MSCNPRKTGIGRWYPRQVAQAVQVAGALLILAYAAAQFDLLNQHSRVYLALNLVGSAVLAVLAWHEEQWGFLLLEGVWALVSLWGWIRVLRGRPSAEAPRPRTRANEWGFDDEAPEETANVLGLEGRPCAADSPDALDARARNESVPAVFGATFRARTIRSARA